MNHVSAMMCHEGMLQTGIKLYKHILRLPNSKLQRQGSPIKYSPFEGNQVVSFSCVEGEVVSQCYAVFASQAITFVYPTFYSCTWQVLHTLKTSQILSKYK